MSRAVQLLEKIARGGTFDNSYMGEVFSHFETDLIFAVSHVDVDLLQGLRNASDKVLALSQMAGEPIAEGIQISPEASSRLRIYHGLCVKSYEQLVPQKELETILSTFSGKAILKALSGCRHYRTLGEIAAITEISKEDILMILKILAKKSLHRVSLVDTYELRDRNTPILYSLTPEGQRIFHTRYIS